MNKQNFNQNVIKAMNDIRKKYEELCSKEKSTSDFYYEISEKNGHNNRKKEVRDAYYKTQEINRCKRELLMEMGELFLIYKN